MTDIEVGQTVTFKLCDSPYTHKAIVLSVETVANGGYVPDYQIYTARDLSTGWVHRLTDRDIRGRQAAADESE